jgi:hypothetical protein
VNEQNKRSVTITLPQDAATRKPEAHQRPISVYINGLDIYFDTEPRSLKGCVMVPMRKIFEVLGADVSWNESERKITAVKNNTTISLTVGKDTAKINGEIIKLDEPAIIQNNRILAPLLFVAESLDCNAEFREEMRRVVITTVD